MIALPETLDHFLQTEYVRGRWLDPKTHQQMDISVRLLDRWATETGQPSPTPIWNLSANLVADWMRWLAADRIDILFTKIEAGLMPVSEIAEDDIPY
jgi:hypothetical protein